MSDDAPRFTNTGPELRPEVCWIGWVLLLGAAILALVVGLGLRGTATAQADLPNDLVDPTASSKTVTLSCAGPGHGVTAPPSGEGNPISDVDAVSEGGYFAGATAELVVGRACDQVRAQRVTHALELGLLGLAVAALGAGLASVRRRSVAPA